MTNKERKQEISKQLTWIWMDLCNAKEQLNYLDETTLSKEDKEKYKKQISNILEEIKKIDL